MSTRKKAAKAPRPIAVRAAIVDPADEHYAESRDDFRAYAQAMKAHNTSPAYYNDTKSDPLGDVGNQRSRQGFAPGGFRHYR